MESRQVFIAGRTKTFIYFFSLFLYNALTISWYGAYNRARLQIKCALGVGDSPQFSKKPLLAYSRWGTGARLGLYYIVL